MISHGPDKGACPVSGVHPVPGEAHQANRLVLPITIVSSLLVVASGLGISWGIWGQRLTQVESKVIKIGGDSEAQGERLHAIERAVDRVTILVEKSEEKANERHTAILRRLEKRARE